MILIEKDERVVNLWRRLLLLTADEIRNLEPPRQGDRCDDMLVAFAAGRTTGDTPEQFTVTSRMTERFTPMVNRIASVVDECRHFQIIHGDYRDAPQVEATWFIDPPYQHIGIGRWDRSRGGRYRHSSRDLNFNHLADWIGNLPGQVIVCEQDGADWMDWTDRVDANSAASIIYTEVFHHRAG